VRDDHDMAGVRRTAGQDLRANWRSVAVLSVLLALVGGAAVGALVGARRTDSVVDRVLIAMHEGDVEVDVSPESGLDADAVRRLPMVKASAIGSYVLQLELKPDGEFGDFDIVTIAGDGPLGRTISAPLLQRGRRADPASQQEVTINEAMARTKRLGIGDTFSLQAWDLEQLEALFQGPGVEPTGHRSRFRVTGIVRDIPDILERRGERRVYPTAAWWRAHGTTSAHFGPAVILVLRNGAADLPALERAVEDMGGSADSVGRAGEGDDTARRAVRVQAVALYLFAALAALVGVAIVAQAVGRQDTGMAVQLRQLRALGMTRRQLLGVALARPATVAGLGTLLAVVLAVATSGALPFGLAGSMEPDPGIVFRPGPLAIGAAVVLVLVLSSSLPGAVRAVRLAARFDEETRRRPSRVPGPTSSLGPAAGAGVGMALDPGQGRAAIPVRTTVFGVVIGVAAVAAALTFASSLERLLSTPARYGFPFDAVLGTADNEDTSDFVLPRLEGADEVEAFTQVASNRLLINGENLPAFGLESVRGSALPTVVRGRLPSAADEIAMGERDLDDTRGRIGATVRARREDGGPTVTLRVVGTVALPPDINAPGGGGHGVTLTLQGLRRIDPEAPMNLIYLNLRPGASLTDLPDGLGDPGNASLPAGGPDLANIARVRRLPIVLAGLLAAIAFASIVHALTAGVRRRRHDLAVLRMLGFSGRQLSTVLAVQATTFAVVALVVGLPVGLALGRWAWAIVARTQGVATDPAVPLLGLSVATGALVVAVNLVAAGPAWAARRVRPATVLRAE
jgi:ABC-type antimicrobial peptide transport system permease subunit